MSVFGYTQKKKNEGDTTISSSQKAKVIQIFSDEENRDLIQTDSLSFSNSSGIEGINKRVDNLIKKRLKKRKKALLKDSKRDAVDFVEGQFYEQQIDTKKDHSSLTSILDNSVYKIQSRSDSVSGLPEIPENFFGSPTQTSSLSSPNKAQVFDKFRTDGGQIENSAIYTIRRSPELSRSIAKYRSRVRHLDLPINHDFAESSLAKYEKIRDSINISNNTNRLNDLMSKTNTPPPVVTSEIINKSVLEELVHAKPKLPVNESIKSKSDSLYQVVYSKKKPFQIGDYREVIIGLTDNDRRITLSPSVGYDINRSLSGGLGLLMDTDFEKDLSVIIGYKFFVRYDLLRDVYFHAESTHFLEGFSTPLVDAESQDFEGHSSSLAAGLGATYSLSINTGLTAQLLYQVIDASSLSISPFIFRFGINF